MQSNAAPYESHTPARVETVDKMRGGNEAINWSAMGWDRVVHAMYMGWASIREMASIWENLACSACGSREKKVHRCSRCRSARYCSKECQRADWAKHKTECA